MADSYPGREIKVVDFPPQFWQLYDAPIGQFDDWPSVQLRYLGDYLTSISCKTVVLESHYIDRDYIEDLELFYSRNLRCYPNYTRRMHFFSQAFDQVAWERLVTNGRSSGREHAEQFLQEAYLGFTIVRPLPGPKVGRTVLRTFGPETTSGFRREFGSVRQYEVHLAGFALKITGLAFQQQDRGVSACATTAVWSSLHRVAHMEGLAIPTPADITQAATRYVVTGGRSLPSEGLSIYQLCEAIRAAGLAPLVIRATRIENDQAQLLSYVSSGFAPVLGITGMTSGVGHAVCAVGVKLGQVQPQTDPSLNYRDAASCVKGVYIHDDRLGPYASAPIFPMTQGGIVRTALGIKWPGQEEEEEHSFLTAIVVPLPNKIRLTASMMRTLGALVGEVIGRTFPGLDRSTTMDCKYVRATDYQRKSLQFPLSRRGFAKLQINLVLSRWLGVVEISAASGPLLDILLDTTETEANPATLAVVRRGDFPDPRRPVVDLIAENLGAEVVQ